MQMDARPVLHRSRTVKQRELHIDALGGFQDIGRRKSHAASQLFDLNSGKVQSCSLAGDGLLSGASVHLHSAHPDATPCGKHFYFLFLAHFSRDQRSSNDGPKAFHHKYTVNRQTE